MNDLFLFIISKYNYWVAIILLLIGLYGMISKNNLLKKVISMAIFQSAIFLFYISIGTKQHATIPIIEHGHNGYDAGHAVIDVANYANPLPHVLMLTAIVVGVATLGVALAVIQKINQVHDTIEEDEILRSMEE